MTDAMNAKTATIFLQIHKRKTITTRAVVFILIISLVVGGCNSFMLTIFPNWMENCFPFRRSVSSGITASRIVVVVEHVGFVNELFVSLVIYFSVFHGILFGD